MTYPFLELLIFFWLTLVDIYCLEFSHHIKEMVLGKFSPGKSPLESSHPSNSALENFPGKFPPRKFPPGIFPPTSLISFLHLTLRSWMGGRMYMYIFLPGQNFWYLQNSPEFSHETLAILINCFSPKSQP